MKSVFRHIEDAVTSGNLPPWFRAAQVNRVLGIHYAGSFLGNHCQTGNSTILFERMSRGLYKIADVSNVEVWCDSHRNELGETVLLGVEAGLPIHYALDARALANKETRIALGIVKLCAPEPVKLKLVIDNNTKKAIRASILRTH
jgi:hypothetical protein